MSVSESLPAPNNTRTETASVQPNRPLTEILNDYDRVTGELQALSAKLFEEIPDFEATATAIQESHPQVMDEIENYDAASDKAGEEWEKLLRDIAATAYPNELTAYAKAVKESRALERTAEQLAFEALDPLEAAFEQARSSVLQHTNWQAAIDGYLARDPVVSPQYLSHLDSMERLGELLGYTQPDWSADTVTARFNHLRNNLEQTEALGKQLQQSGLLTVEADEQSAMVDSPDLALALHEAMSDVKQGMDFMASDKRREALKTALLEQMSQNGTPYNRLRHLIHTLGMDAESNKRPIQAVRAIARQIQLVMEHFDDMDDRLRKQLAPSLPRAIMVAGQNRIVARTLGASPLSWTRQELLRLPQWFYGHLGIVRYVETIEPNGRVINSHDDSVWETTGRYNADKNQILVGVQRSYLAEVRQSLEAGDAASTAEEADDIASKLYKVILSDNLMHETGHYATAYTLPLGDLRAWARISRTSTSDVSAYAAMHRRESGQGLAAEEDFAETLRLYMNRPSALFLNFPERFRFMNKLIGRFSAETIEEARKLIPDISGPVALARMLKLFGRVKDSAQSQDFPFIPVYPRSSGTGGTAATSAH